MPRTLFMSYHPARCATQKGRHDLDLAVKSGGFVATHFENGQSSGWIAPSLGRNRID